MREDLNGGAYNMRGYYAFGGRYRHAVATTTPPAILEMGCLADAGDRAFLLAHPELAARGIADGVLAFLRDRDPSDSTAIVPPAPVVLWPARPSVPLHAAADHESTVSPYLQPTDPAGDVGGRVGAWYDVRVRGSYRDFGWVHAADITADRS